MQLHAGDGERVAFQELQHAEALDALADRVMRAVGRGDVAEHASRRADPVQVIGSGLFDFGLALQQHSERALQARRLLGRRARALAADRQRKHHAGEQHDVAHRHDDECVLGQRARGGFPPRLSLGGAALDVRAGVGGERRGWAAVGSLMVVSTRSCAAAG